MPYSDLEHEGRIRRHGLTPDETRQRIAELLALADRDLEDAAISQRPADGRHNSAYEAARSIADAVMVAEGYRRLGGEGQHKVLFDFLARVGTGMFARRAAYFDKARRLRNKTKYDKAGIVSSSMAAGILKNAREFRAEVQEWLASAHPELVDLEP
jgi:uncharacterized protein YjiS (DUF1127 family)